MTLADVSDLVKDVTVVIASLMAIYGIRSWQREFIGKRRIELAEETLSLFYQARAAIEQIRSPMSFGGEGETRKSSPTETPELKTRLDQAFVLAERYNNNIELFSRISALRFRFIAILGESASLPFDVLQRVLNTLISACHMRMIEIRGPDPTYLPEAAKQSYFARVLKNDAIYWSVGSEEDPLKPDVDSMMLAIENICRPMIESKGPFAGRLSWLLGK